jgi:hypothetical protein
VQSITPRSPAARESSLELLSAFVILDEHLDSGQSAVLQFLQGLISERLSLTQRS